MDNSKIQFFSQWAINNTLIDTTKTLSVAGYNSWTLLEDLNQYGLQEPPRLYVRRLISGDRWGEANAAGPEMVTWAVRKDAIYVKNPNASGATTMTLRYKVMTKGMG